MNRKYSLLLTLLATVLLSVAHVRAQAYVASLSGGDESPPNHSPGHGSAVITFNASVHTMRVQIQFMDLTTGTTAAHVHAPTAEPFQGTAGVATQTPYFTGFPLGVTSGNYDHTFNTLDAGTWNPTYISDNGGTPAGAEAAFAMALAQGKAYVNIHTSMFSSGEIRGFLVPNSVTDFNADYNPDLVLFNPSTHRTVLWYLNDNEFVSSASSQTLPAGWSVPGVADFNQDGKPDYLLFNAQTRETMVSYLNGPTVIDTAAGPTLPSGWTLVTTGDVNGDGKPDFILFNSTSRRTAIWYMNNTNYVSSSFGPTLPPDWMLLAALDFNHDANVDYLLFNPTTHRTALWYLNGPNYVSGAYGPTIVSGYALIGAADFNQDGKLDLLLYNSSTRRTAIWYLQGSTYVGSAYGPTINAGWMVVAP